MSLHGNISHLSTTPGVEAVFVQAPQGSVEFRGRGELRAALQASADLLRLTTEPTLRVVLGDHTIVAVREGTEMVSLAIPTGHAVAKSLRRMVRRMARRDRPPVLDLRPNLAPLEMALA
jgi:hypothetical protein